MYSKVMLPEGYLNPNGIYGLEEELDTRLNVVGTRALNSSDLPLFKLRVTLASQYEDYLLTNPRNSLIETLIKSMPKRVVEGQTLTKKDKISYKRLVNSAIVALIHLRLQDGYEWEGYSPIGYSCDDGSLSYVQIETIKILSECGLLNVTNKDRDRVLKQYANAEKNYFNYVDSSLDRKAPVSQVVVNTFNAVKLVKEKMVLVGDQYSYLFSTNLTSRLILLIHESAINAMEGVFQESRANQDIMDVYLANQGKMLKYQVDYYAEQANQIDLVSSLFVEILEDTLTTPSRLELEQNLNYRGVLDVYDLLLDRIANGTVKVSNAVPFDGLQFKIALGLFLDVQASKFPKSQRIGCFTNSDIICRALGLFTFLSKYQLFCVEALDEYFNVLHFLKSQRSKSAVWEYAVDSLEELNIGLVSDNDVYPLTEYVGKTTDLISIATKTLY